MHRFHPSVLRAAWWAWWAVRKVRQQLPVEGVRTVVGAPPELPAAAGRGVWAVLRRLSPTCLERALVAQRWLAAHGDPVEIVIGARLSGEGGDKEARALSGHAWLAGSEAESAAAFEELWRIPAP